ncbi:hypothetical protein ACROYT_G024995 [Oculina patagonica]
MSARPVDETPRPDESLKMAANMKIFEIGQVYTAVNISLRRYQKDSLLNHSNRAIYQASIWTSLDEQQVVPSPTDFCWKMDNDRWRPRWTILPEAAKACSELLKCGCRTGCSSGRCKCFKANLPCTELCGCSGGCQNSSL